MLPPTVPKDYEDLLSYYTKHGFRVIAIAGKSIPGLTWLKAQRMKRSVPDPLSAPSRARRRLTPNFSRRLAGSRPSPASTSSG